MNQYLIQKLQYKYTGKEEAVSLPLPLEDSFQLIANFFSLNTTNKLCLVFPSKEYCAQWLTVPTVLHTIENDYKQYKEEIFESYKQFKIGDKLKLNGDAIVEWAGIRNNSVAFRAGKEPNTATFTIEITQSIKLQRAEQQKGLSSLKKVKQALPGKVITPTDELLEINTFGNKHFMKNKICLVSKFKTYDESITEITLNNASIPEYFENGKIGENGSADTNSPLLISNNLSNLAMYIEQSSNSVSKIIIDGFSAIHERGTDFSDIDLKKIPTILITDLSEIEHFENIGNYGFEFFNFTKDNLKLDDSAKISPFYSFENKLRKYISFNVLKEICQDKELEITIKKIHSIDNDKSNNDLISIKISLVQLTNLISRVAYKQTANEISTLNYKINIIETMFQRCRMWLGNSHRAIEECIALLKSIIARFATNPSEKCVRLNQLLSIKQYDYIICCTEEEAKVLNNSLPEQIRKPKVISVADINERLLSSTQLKAIITGWVKSTAINKIISSFHFSELTLLFYHFENNYYGSLLRKNKQYTENIKTTINSKGIRTETDSEKRKGFGDLYSNDEATDTNSEKSYDIIDLEIKFDSVQYSKYTANGQSIDSIKAKRIVFDSDYFIYTTESHKFLLINNLIQKNELNTNLQRRKIESLQTGDFIALINTDRDILAELVEKNTNSSELASVKHWTELWKNLLKEYYVSIKSDFKKLVEDLRQNDCKKHEVTIRTWLQDESRIGPDDDADLISIALLTNSNLLNDNIKKVRDSITKMKGWRHNVSDLIISKIKAQIQQYIDNLETNKQISIDGLGSVNILKITEISNTWDHIDVRYVNRLLQKEII